MFPLTLPAIIHEQFVKPFKFYFNNELCKGMNYQGRLYTISKTFTSAQRADAFVLACKLSAQETQTVITLFQEQYTVWIDLCHVQKTQFSGAEETDPLTNAIAVV
jgi:hypothetical protein